MCLGEIFCRCMLYIFGSLMPVSSSISLFRFCLHDMFFVENGVLNYPLLICGSPWLIKTFIQFVSFINVNALPFGTEMLRNEKLPYCIVSVTYMKCPFLSLVLSFGLKSFCCCCCCIVEWLNQLASEVHLLVQDRSGYWVLTSWTESRKWRALTRGSEVILAVSFCLWWYTSSLY